MKVERMSKFEPVKITLETQEEVDAIYAVANFTPIGEAVQLFARLQEQMPHSSEYRDYHERLGRVLEKWYGKK